MFDKLKLTVLGFLGVMLMMSTISQGYSTWQMVKSKDAYDQARTDLTQKEVGVDVLANLQQRLNQSEAQDLSTQARFDALEVELRGPKPEQVAPSTPEKPVQRTAPAKVPKTTKEAIDENLHLPKPASSNIALRAINELWIDFCKRFPSERDCGDRGLQTSELQASTAPRS